MYKLINKFIRRTNFRYAIVILAVFLLSFAIGISFDAYGIGIDSETFSWITIITCVVAVFLEEYIYKHHIENKLNEKESGHILLDEENETAILLQRSNISATYFSHEPIYYMNYKNHDAKLVYTGATVGGIHTGGFHTTEAYTSYSAKENSGRSHIFVRREVNEKIETIEIKKIKLIPVLLAEAKKDNRLNKFIVDDYISLRNNGNETKLTVAEQDILIKAIENNDTALKNQITERAFVSEFLLTSDVTYILNWISGKQSLSIPSNSQTSAPSVTTAPPATQMYSCPACKGMVAHGEPKCKNCGTTFNWG